MELQTAKQYFENIAGFMNDALETNNAYSIDDKTLIALMGYTERFVAGDPLFDNWQGGYSTFF